jgi:hypothetical protein
MVEDNLEVVATLKQCGLWKFLYCPLMRAQPRLLNHLVEYWNPYAEAFMLEGQSLAPTTEDIYFLTSLSRRGELVDLDTFPLRPYNIAHYIDMYCEADTKKVGSQVPIQNIENLSLRVVLYMIGWMTRSNTLHQASDPQMHCAMQCLQTDYIRLENHHAQLHENSTDRVQVEVEEKLWIQDSTMHILL